MNALARFLYRRRLRKAIRRIKQEALFWGYDLTDCDADELTARIRKARMAISQCGVSMEEASEAIRKFAAAAAQKLEPKR